MDRIDPKSHISSEFFLPIRRQMQNLFRAMQVETSGRLVVHLAEWEVEYTAGTRETSQGKTEIFRSPVYRMVNFWVDMEIDGIPAGRTEFQFSMRSLSDIAAFDEAIEGSAGTLFWKAHAILEHGFCPTCDQPYSRDQAGGLLCECITKAATSAKSKMP